MELSGEQFLSVTRERVWEALNDPEILRESVPGCESLEKVEENHYKVVMVAAVGPIKAKFNGKLTLSDLQPPQGYTLTFEGSGGAAGFGKGGAQVTLTEVAGGTQLTYSAHAQVGGRLAQVGSRLVDGVAKKMAEDFFGRFKKRVVPAATESAAGTFTADQAAVAAAPVAASALPGSPAVAATGRSRMWLWGAVVVVVLIAVVAYVMR